MIKVITPFILLVLLIACKNEGENAKDFEKDNYSQSINKSDLTFLEYEIKFPDTVLVNKAYDGEILFKSPLDSITEEFFDKKEDRYVVFRCPESANYKMNRRFFRDSLSEYRFGAIDNRTIPFYDLSFNKTGVYKVKGLINDLVLIELPEKNEEGEDLIRLIENDFPVEFKVVVIESRIKVN